MKNTPNLSAKQGQLYRNDSLREERESVRMASLKGWCWRRAGGGEKLALRISALRWEEYK